MLPAQLPEQLTATPAGHWHDRTEDTVMPLTFGAELMAAAWMPAVLVEFVRLVLANTAPACAAEDTAVAVSSDLPSSSAPASRMSSSGVARAYSISATPPARA